MVGYRIKRKKITYDIIWSARLLIAAMICMTIWIVGDQYILNSETPSRLSAPVAGNDQHGIDETLPTKNDIDQHEVPPHHPRYISIPAISISQARVQAAGLTKNNALDTPRNISDAAWYTKSAYPGQGHGAVLINGHNGGFTRDGVLANLYKLKDGDEIIIERGDGKVFSYKVVENQTESLESVNSTGMNRLLKPYDETRQGLSLITCGGNWNPKDQVFDKRVLIRAVAIEIPN